MKWRRLGPSESWAWEKLLERVRVRGMVFRSGRRVRWWKHRDKEAWGFFPERSLRLKPHRLWLRTEENDDAIEERERSVRELCVERLGIWIGNRH